MSGLFTCGSAHGCITPESALMPNLRGLRNSLIGGVLDDLYVRVVALGNGTEKALLIAFDLDKAPYPMEQIAKITQRTGIPEQNILMFSIHTHTCPVTGFRPEEGPNDIRKKPKEVQQATAQYEKQIFDVLHRCVDQAIEGMRPARVGYATGESYINVHRNQEYTYMDENGALHNVLALGVNPKQWVDRTLFAMRFEDLQESPIAFFLNYPVHNCVMHANQCCDGKLGISSDIGGNICRFLEEANPGATAIWSSGAAGDVNPLASNEAYYPNPQTGKMQEFITPGGDYSMLTVLAARHYADVQAVLRNITCSTTSIELHGLIDWIYTPGRDVIVKEDGTLDSITGESVSPYEVRVQLLRLGSVFFYGFSGELVSALGKRVQGLLLEKKMVIINHNLSLAARSGYIFDDETLLADTENMLPGHRNSHMLPGYFQEALLSKTIELFKKLEEGKQ